MPISLNHRRGLPLLLLLVSIVASGLLHADGKTLDCTAGEENWDPARATKFAALVEWFKSKGGFIHSSIEYRDGGMFVVDEGDIEKGEVILEFPTSAVFPPVEKREEGRFITHDIPDPMRPKTTRDAVEIAKKLWSSEYTDDFGPYFNILPTTCQTVVCGNKPPEVYEISPIGQLFVDNMIKEIPEDLRVAYSVVSSRMSPLGMLPMIDLFNHDGLSGETFTKGKKGGSKIIASRDYDEEEEVHIDIAALLGSNTFQFYVNANVVGSSTMGFDISYKPAHPCFTQIITQRLPHHSDKERIKCILDYEPSNKSDEDNYR